MTPCARRDHFYRDREPVGPYRLIVPARRTQHLRFNERIFVLAFEAGDEFVEAIRQFATEQKVNAGWFNGLGAFREATIAYFLLEEKRYEEIPIVEQVEVAGLTGNLALKDDAIVVQSLTSSAVACNPAPPRARSATR